MLRIIGRTQGFLDYRQKYDIYLKIKSMGPSNISECFLFLNVGPPSKSLAVQLLLAVSGLVAHVDPPRKNTFHCLWKREITLNYKVVMNTVVDVGGFSIAKWNPCWSCKRHCTILICAPIISHYSKYYRGDCNIGWFPQISAHCPFKPTKPPNMDAKLPECWRGRR